MSVCPSVRPHGTTRLLLDGFSRNLIYDYFTKISRESSSLIKCDNNNGSFTRKPMYTYDHYLAEFVLEWKNFTQNCRETQNTHFIFSNFFSRKSFCLWGDLEKYVRAGIGHIWPYDAWIRKATNTLAEYVSLTAFPLQQWLHERASVLRCTYIACIVYYNSVQPPPLPPLIHVKIQRKEKFTSS